MIIIFMYVWVYSNTVEEWSRLHQLKYLPIPEFVSAGLHEVESGHKYRFMVMERLGDDLEKHFSVEFNLKTICYVGLRMVCCFV